MSAGDRTEVHIEAFETGNETHRVATATDAATVTTDGAQQTASAEVTVPVLYPDETEG